MENTAKILATKRAWKHGDLDRRKTRNERKDLSTALREGRRLERSLKPYEEKAEFSAFVMAICITLAVLLIVLARLGVIHG